MRSLVGGICRPTFCASPLWSTSANKVSPRSRRMPCNRSTVSSTDRLLGRSAIPLSIARLTSHFMYPAIEPYETGLLDAGEGNLIYWETCGNPSGKPALVLHGGPGSGCSPWFRRLFDPAAYRVVLLDHHNCGRSRPDASDPGTDLSSITTLCCLSVVE